jgi:hypothetical protein
MVRVVKMATTVQLEDEEWQRVLGILAQQPWQLANPLIMRIGEQLRMQQPRDDPNARARPNGPDEQSTRQ